MLLRPSRGKLLGVVALILSGIGAGWLYDAGHTTQDLREIATEHFVISYIGVSSKDAEKVAEVLEESRPRVLSALNVEHHPPVTVYLHPTQKSFDEATGWTGAIGTSAGPEVVHLVWPRASPQAAVHEFVHTVQLNRLIEYGEKAGWDEAEFEQLFAERYPRWLWEGTSAYLANERSRVGVFWVMRGGRRPALASFVRSNNDIYRVGYTIPEFIVTQWGATGLADLVGSFGDVESAFGISLIGFEKQWHEFVEAQYTTF